MELSLELHIGVMSFVRVSTQRYVGVQLIKYIKTLYLVNNPCRNVCKYTFCGKI